MEKLPKTSPFFVKKKRRAEFLTQEVARFKSWWCFGFCFGFCRFFACFFHGNFNRCSGTTPQWLPTELLPCRALEKGRVGLWTILTRIVHTYMMHIYIYTHIICIDMYIWCCHWLSSYPSYPDTRISFGRGVSHTLLGRFETSLLSLVGISFREVSENPRKGFKRFNLGSCFILLRSGVWLLANQLRVVG